MKAAAKTIKRPNAQFITLSTSAGMLIVVGGTTGVTPPVCAPAIPIGDKVRPKAIEASLDFNLLIMFVKNFDLFNNEMVTQKRFFVKTNKGCRCPRHPIGL